MKKDETRLISNVSKPIKVVVVVVAIVVVFFCQKKLGPKDCDPKTIHAHKTLGLKGLYPKSMWVTKKVGTNSVRSKN